MHNAVLQAWHAIAYADLRRRSSQKVARQGAEIPHPLTSDGARLRGMPCVCRPLTTSVNVVETCHGSTQGRRRRCV